MYSKYIHYDYLISPINGRKVKAILTPNSIRKFGFSSINELEDKYPGFPRMCESTKIAYKNRKTGVPRLSKNEYLGNELECNLCGRKLPHYKQTAKFCGLSCSASYNNLKKNSDSVLDLNIKIQKYQNRGPYSISGDYTAVYCNTCEFTGELFYSTKKQTYRDDAYLHFKKAYVSKCKFKFSLNNTIVEGSDLIAVHGFYHPVTNPTGVSRDHIMSISDGWKNKIDPSIISHPCNCRIILHSENNKKNTISDITIDELLDKIKKYEIQMGLEPT